MHAQAYFISLPPPGLFIWFHRNLHCPKGVLDGLQAGKSSSARLKWKTFNWWVNLLAYNRKHIHFGSLWINKSIYPPVVFGYGLFHKPCSYPRVKFLYPWFSVYSTDIGVQWCMWSIRTVLGKFSCPQNQMFGKVLCRKFLAKPQLWLMGKGERQRKKE